MVSKEDDISVAVIGCGPGGMFYCHAIETLRRSTDKKVSVTCFDRMAQPGGVWRAQDTSKTDGSIGMYSGLWTNGPSQCVELPDYTFDEHFGRPVSVYMPRTELLDYMLARVTKNCPDFFEKYVEFEKDIVNVSYDEDAKRFSIVVKCLKTGTITTRFFDKCVWACGENGTQDIPGDLLKICKDGGFTGRLIHSADTANLREDVAGKRVLLIGGGQSAEDLALQIVKLGVDRVFIAARADDADIVDTKAWPLGKVETLVGFALSAVKDQGRCMEFEQVEWTWPNSYFPAPDGEKKTLHDIETVIFCTGYGVNKQMLDPTLRGGANKFEGNKDFPLDIPTDWEMPSNMLSGYVASDLKPTTVLCNTGTMVPDFYLGVLISNPGMMHMMVYGTDFPILAVDSYAWLFASFTLGLVELPSAEEMRKHNLLQTLDELKLPYSRYYMDKAYFDAVEKAVDFENEDDLEIWGECEWEFGIYQLKCLARVMRLGNYPMDIGTYDTLNATGEMLDEFNELSYEHRNKITPEVIESKPWKTFRDYDDASSFYSPHTETKAVPLPRRWLDMDVGPDCCTFDSDATEQKVDC